jgi:hypothetical protein
MAILYVFTVNDPNNAGAFPPSVTASSWGTNTNAWFQKNQIAGSENSNVVLFADETALNAFLSTHTLADPGLLADITSWKSTHGVSYSSQYFTLTSAEISPTSIVS